MKKFKINQWNATWQRSVAIIFSALLTMGVFIRADEIKPTIVLGLGSDDAEKYNVEFMQFNRMKPLYEANHIQASLMEFSGLVRADWTEERLYQTFKKYHVIEINSTDEGVYKLTDQFQKRAAVVGKALARYVEEGGGLFITPIPVRYPGSEDEKYWNLVLGPFGMEILHEGVYDETRSFQDQTIKLETFWFTRNIQAHPVTDGVSGLCLPLFGGHGNNPGVPAIKYSPEWEILVRGEKEAKSYRASEDNKLNLTTEGTYSSAPPVFAVRTFGKGRVACYPLSHIFTRNNMGNPLWSHVVETKGDRDAGRPSDSMKMQMNTYRWLGESVINNLEFGTYRPEPYKLVDYPAQVDWSKPELLMTPKQIDAATEVRAIAGAHTAYTDGTGTVAQYVEAAKVAGLTCIIFSDPLEKLTKETLEKLKVDCAEASKGGDFYACPGIEFTDGTGNRWAFWGEKITWPAATFQQKGNTFVQWDGQRVNLYGEYSDACGFPGSALLDYQQLRKNGAHPENLWWFWGYLPLVYDHGKLVADNFNDYLFGLRDMRWASVASFTRITAPSEVAQAASLCYTSFNSLPSAKAALNTRGNPWSTAKAARQYVSQGPQVVAFDAVNYQRHGEAKYMRGVQRVRLHFAVRSEQGIAEVRIHDADRGLIRRFLGHGAKQLAREFELVHDRQHNPTLEVIDTEGKRAFSTQVLVYCYKSHLHRCGDNLNILGPTATWWHPDRNEFFMAAKDFRNASLYTLSGWDSATSSGVPKPEAFLWDMVNLKEANGWYPSRDQLGAVPSRMMDVGVNNSDLYSATMRMTKLSQTWDTKARPSPSFASVAKDMGDIEFFDRTHTIYAPMERVNMFTAWDHRRTRESLKDYQGGIIWHEGEFRFKKDVTLQGDLPIPLLWERCPTDLKNNVGTVAIMSDADRQTRVTLLTDTEKPVRTKGHLKPGGYAAWMTTPVGYHAFLVPPDNHYVYTAEIPSHSGLKIGMGEHNQVVKAGTVMRYRFGVATFTDPKAGNDLLEHTVKAMNLGGGHDGYPVEMKVGRVKDAVFFFTAEAENHEAAFTLGPQSLIMDLPIRVQGIVDNGCAAVYSTKTPWFRFVAVDEQGTAWLTESIDAANEMWVGNVFVCEHKEIKLTLVVDGQAKGARPFLELHNPTDKAIETIVRSPEHTPVFGGMSGKVKIPAGDSVRLTIEDKQFQLD